MRIIFFTIITLIFLEAKGQNSKTNLNTCEKNSNKYALSFIQHFDNQNKDSVFLIFKRWEESCNLCEPLQRAKILYHLKENTFNDSILGDGIVCNIKYFIQRKKYYLFRDPGYFSYVPIGKEFDTFTDSISKKLQRNYDKNTIEYLFCELYSNKSDSILIKIRQPKFRFSKIQLKPCKIENKRKEKGININKTGYNIAFMSGIWIPTGGLKVLGVHPELGFQGGLKNLKYSAQFTLIIKFLNTPNKYLARRIHTNNSVEETNTFVGPYVGLDFGRSFYHSAQSEFQILSGIGFDAFTALKPLNDKDRYEDVRSYNLNFGFGYRLYFKKRPQYIGIETKFNVVDYALNNVTELKGNFISIRFTYGHIDNK